MSATIKLDEAQSLLRTKLAEFAQKINRPSLLERFSLKKPTYAKGFYIYGGVGQGKTLLLKQFYEQVRLSKKMIHFQKFMYQLHQNMHKLRNSLQDGKQVIEQIAKNLYQDCQCLCLDELEVTDITDAMVVARVLKKYNQLGGIVVLTSNFAPSGLYRNGLQRENFLPFIDYLEQNYQQFNLRAVKDYRVNRLKNKEVIFEQISVYSKEQIHSFISEYYNFPIMDILEPKVIKIFGREVYFKQAYKDFLFTNYIEFFNQDLSASDYIEICKEFNHIVILDFPILSDDEINQVIRFINFIDNAYAASIILVAEFATSIDEIYTGSKKQKEFERTCSRLAEMQSSDYINQILDQ